MKHWYTSENKIPYLRGKLIKVYIKNHLCFGHVDGRHRFKNQIGIVINAYKHDYRSKNLINIECLIGCNRCILFDGEYRFL